MMRLDGLIFIKKLILQKIKQHFKKTESSNNDTNCFKKHWVTHELQGTDMSFMKK